MTREQAIKTAAKWWTDKLREKPRHNNGDNSSSSFFACLFADMAAADICAADPLEDKLPIFRAELEKAIEEIMDKFSRAGGLVIGSDYGPTGPLYDAAKKAGIKEILFPFKTDVVIERNYGETEFKVRASAGYAQPYEYLSFTEEDDHG